MTTETFCPGARFRKMIWSALLLIEKLKVFKSGLIGCVAPTGLLTRTNGEMADLALCLGATATVGTAVGSTKGLEVGMGVGIATMVGVTEGTGERDGVDVDKTGGGAGRAVLIIKTVNSEVRPQSAMK